jgi:hypothetical protein
MLNQCRRTWRGRILWRAEKATSTAEASREAKLRRLQTMCQGRSGSLASTFGGEGDQVCVNSSGRGLTQRVKRHTREAEDLKEEGPQLLEEGRDYLRMWPSGEARESMVKAKAKPIGKVLSGPTTCSEPVASLFSQQGLCPLWDGGEAEATLSQRGMELVVGQPLKPASPQEVPRILLEPSHHRAGEGQDLGEEPGL